MVSVDEASLETVVWYLILLKRRIKYKLSILEGRIFQYFAEQDRRQSGNEATCPYSALRAYSPSSREGIGGNWDAARRKDVTPLADAWRSALGGGAAIDSVIFEL